MSTANERMEKFFRIVSSLPTTLYIEHNHHFKIQKTTIETVEGLIYRQYLDPDIATLCLEHDSIWFCRYYPHHTSLFYEAYGPTLYHVINEVMEDIEFYEKSCS